MAQRTVIVVDDNAGLLKSVARLLARHGIDSRAFASAEALLESGSVQTATCLLLDIHLGGISGIELQRLLAAGADIARERQLCAIERICKCIFPLVRMAEPNSIMTKEE